MPDKYDRFGHCVKCHKSMIEEVTFKGPRGYETITRFTPEKDRIVLMLSDGSEMGVSICKQCKAKYSDDDIPYIMDCVYKGWEKETEGLVATGFTNKVTGKKWDNEMREQYLAKMKTLSGVTRSDNIERDLQDKKLKIYKEKVKNGDRK